MPVHLRRRQLLAMIPAAVAALGLSAACSQAGSAPKTANEQQSPPKPADSKPAAAANPVAATASSPVAAAAPKPAPKSMAGPPAMAIDQNKTYTAIIKTSLGEMTAELYAKDAPNTVNNFVFLSKEGFYNGVIFHRVIKEFMIQTGDPQGTGMGGPGYKFNDELTGPQTYQKGTLAMANAGPNTQGSQFFICHGSRAETLPKRYSIFGKVTAGLETLDKIANVPVKPGGSGENSSPVDPPKIDTVQISEA